MTKQQRDELREAIGPADKTFFGTSTKLLIALLDLADEADRLREENAFLQARITRWQSPSITLCYTDPDGNREQERCEIRDVGHSEVALLIECQAVDAALARPATGEVGDEAEHQ